MIRVLHPALAALVLCLAAFPASARDRFAQNTEDGLARVEHRRIDALYERPGAALAQYRKVAVQDCSVSFRKNWLRDQNRDRPLTLRVDQRDMDRIGTRLATACRDIFSKALADAGLEVVTDAGADVLVLQPAIVDLDLYVPDVDSPGLVRIWSESAGELTLNLDLRAGDASVARIIDHEHTRRDPSIQQRSRASNDFDLQAVLRQWARLVRTELAS
ncbi:MAG: DUF3313 family protein [Xanthomonadales bacterium]|nr:DUF3313 family protein [Xanthomonadales bacterium]